MPVISATQEVEARESLEPGRQSLSELRLYHCTPAWVTEQVLVSIKKVITEANSSGNHSYAVSHGCSDTGAFFIRLRHKH